MFFVVVAVVQATVRSYLVSLLPPYSHTVALPFSAPFSKTDIISLHTILQWFPITTTLKFILFCQGALGIQGLNPPHSSRHPFPSDEATPTPFCPLPALSIFPSEEL